MAPPYTTPKYDDYWQDDFDSAEKSEDGKTVGLTHLTFWYMVVLIGMMLVWLFVFFCLRLMTLRQKTRNPQQRRMYAGTRQRPSLAPQEPTIYVSPANLPPPPKYEAMAPPSYEEVVGIHSPYYQATQIQPITQPISTAMSQSTNVTPNVTNRTTPDTVVTVSTSAEPRRTSVVVATS